MEAAKTATTKTDLLAAFDRERAGWETLLAEIGEERMLRPGAAGERWTFKDVVAHLNDWRSRTIDRVEAVARGEEPPPPPWPAGMEEETDEGVDQINDWFYERSKDRTLADVLTESREQYQRLRDAIAAIPEPDLLQPGRFSWLEGEALGPAVVSFSHYHEEHEPSIRAWLARLDAASGG